MEKSDVILQQKIRDYCTMLGLNTIGFLPCRKLTESKDFYKQRQEKGLFNEFEEKDVEKRINPDDWMEGGKTIISIAFPYLYEQPDKKNGFSVYTKRADYHNVVNQYLNKICEFIETLGGRAKGFVDSNALPERYLAFLAGVGFIGRNNMLITKEYGSYVFLGEIITNLEISCEELHHAEEIAQYNECKDCNLCLEECPTKSIHKSGTNPNVCLSYITQKKDISDKEIELLKGNLFGCDFCQLKCPHNQKAATSVLREFAVLSYMEEPVETYAMMNNAYFKEKISKTSCGWRGKNVIIRNALIQMHQEKKDISSIVSTSPYVNDYITRLKKK